MGAPVDSLNVNVSALISLAQQGDAEARAELLAHFREYLSLLARLHVQPILKSKFDASDIVQETCLQAVESFDQFRGNSERQFAAWLRQILANKGAWMARRYLDADKRDVRLEQQLADNFDQTSLNIASFLPAQSASPSAAAMQRERSVLLSEAIARLPRGQAEVLIRHGLQGTAIRDVASALNLTEANTWKLWARGLQALRQLLKE